MAQTPESSDPMRAALRTRLMDELRQRFEATVDQRVDRWLQINQQGIIADHYFAAASSQCIDLYRDGHFIAAVMASQAVNEGILKLLYDRNSIKATKHEEGMAALTSRGLVSQACADASERIWRSFRCDVHHMNPRVANIPFQQLAKQNLEALAVVEREVFGVDIERGKLVPKQPKYWDVRRDGTVPVFLRLGI